MALTVNQKGLIKKYKESVISEISDKSNSSLDLIIGKDFKDQKIELKRFAQEHRLPLLEDKLAGFITEKNKIQKEIDAINDAISTW